MSRNDRQPSKGMCTTWTLLEAALAALLLYIMAGAVATLLPNHAEQDPAKTTVLVLIGCAVSLHGIHVIHRIVRGVRARLSVKRDQP